MLPSTLPKRPKGCKQADNLLALAAVGKDEDNVVGMDHVEKGDDERVRRPPTEQRLGVGAIDPFASAALGPVRLRNRIIKAATFEGTDLTFEDFEGARASCPASRTAKLPPAAGPAEESPQ